GYWKDVGTVKSLWEANMDLLNEDCELNLFDNTWRIYSVNPNQPPQFIAPEAEILDSLINEGCMIEGEIERSVLFQGVKVESGAVIRESVIMPDAVIGKNAYIEKAIIPADIRIPDGAIICGDTMSEEIVLVTEELINEMFSKK
ncbi:MAG TPA: glucose-1-phosphate adenylyltransferase, partial [Pseudoneobacillus sp.]|nr:glucose-1-phosphate adenylyltransferase [Pseudoneobacillus sp.]